MPPLTTRKRSTCAAQALTAPQRPSNAATQLKSKAADMIATVLAARVILDPPTNMVLEGPSSGSELSDAAAQKSATTAVTEAVQRYAAVLRAIYVVAHTEKAQRKVRSAGGGILDSSGSLTPHKQMNRAAAGSSSNSSSTAAFQGAFSPAGRSLSLTRPDTPRRSIINATAAVASGSPFGGSGDISVVVFADPRWLTAVSELAQTTVNIDFLAKISKVFPEHLTVTWSRNTAPHLDAHFALSLGNRLDEFLRELAPTDGSYLADSGGRSHGGDAENTLHGELRARVTLSKFEIPDVSALVADLEARGGVERIALFSDVTAARLAIEDAPGHTTPRTAEPPTCPTDVFTRTLCSTESLLAEYDDSAAAAARKRKRECDAESPTLSSASTFDAASLPQQLPLVGLSEQLIAHLSDAKLKQVASASSALQQGEMMREAQRIEHQRQVEKLLSIYDLIHGLLGSSRTCIGGARLIEDLVVQNRYGCSRDEVCGVVQRLLEIPSSGIQVKRLIECGHGETSDAGKTLTEFDEVLFVIEPHGCRAGLAAAVELGRGRTE